MARVFGIFDTRAQAEDAAQRLLDAGIPAETLTLVAHDERAVTVGAADLAAQSQTASASALLAGIGMAPLPSLGPAVMFGAPLTPVAGLLPGEAEPALDPRLYAEGVRRGGSLVSVMIDDELADVARRTLLAAGAVDVGQRAAQWQSEGWAPAGGAEEYDPFGLNWAESSKFGTGGGALAGAVAGATAGAIGGPVGAVLGGIAGAAVGASVGAIGDVAGEAFAPVRNHTQPDEEPQ